ncbi:MAG: M14 family metallopeptidase [Prochloraceae cyanobacterium]
MSYANAFSPNYLEARNRFRSSALARGCRLSEYAIDQKGPNGENLTLDVAILGAASPQKIVLVSSGIHGVEGFFGSAVQVALLEERLVDWSPPPGASLILLHALNPYGFAWRRRTNEDNIDLNRNFLLAGEEYQGSPNKYGDLDVFFNPTSPPSRFEPFLIKAIFLILRHGMSSLKNTLPVGQYDYPKGLFFGGHGPSKTYQILDTHLDQWVGNATDVIHIDLHTGLGRKATYKLLIQESADSKRVQWLKEKFGADMVEIIDPKGTAYSIRGGLGKWCQAKFPQCNYNFLTAEFGTYSSLRGIKVLRAENRAHFWGQTQDASCEWTGQQLMEFAAPAAPAWRSSVVSQGLDLVQRAIDVCF